MLEYDSDSTDLSGDLSPIADESSHTPHGVLKNLSDLSYTKRRLSFKSPPTTAIMQKAEPQTETQTRPYKSRPTVSKPLDNNTSGQNAKETTNSTVHSLK